HRTQGAEGMTRQRIADVSFIVWLAAFTVCVFALPFGAQIVAGASGLVVVAAYTVGWLASPAAHDIPPRKAHPAAVETCVECAGTGWLLDQAYGIASIPAGWTPVQACDQCGRYLDADAAYAAAV